MFFNQTMRTAYLSHPVFLRHEAGSGHPERPARLHAIEDRLIASGIMDLLRHHEAPPAARDQLCRVHTEAYVDFIGSVEPGDAVVMLDPDTGMNRYSLEAATRAAGAAVRAVELVMSGEAENAFCAVRPPGHHAGPDRAMGFCIFNNVAVGAAHALARFGLPRVAIVDFDVHHGNGTEAIFRDDPRVLLCSSFQHPWYPYPSLARPPANVRYAPLPAGSDGTTFRRIVGETLLPALDAFQPAMIFISAGFDGHRGDELGGLSLTESDFAWITREVMAIAERHASRRVVSLLEGGYHLPALGASVLAHLRALMVM